MTIEETKDEIIIRVPKDTDMSAVEKLLKMLQYSEAVKNSQAKQEDVDIIAKEAKSDWWENNKDRFLPV